MLSVSVLRAYSSRVMLNHDIYYGYIWNPAPEHNGPDPSAPVWTGVRHGLPPITM